MPCLIMVAMPAGITLLGVKMLVRIRPGQMALTRTPSRASSAAATLVRWMTPALATE